MKRLFALVLSIGLLAAVALPAIANDDAFGDPNKVWVCHFEDHEAGGVFFISGIGEPLDGDYILTWKDEAQFPTAIQSTFCLDPYAPNKLLPVAGELILISVNAVGENDVRGHRVQNRERGIASYPNGYKG